MISTYDIQKILYTDCKGIDFNSIFANSAYGGKSIPVYHGFNTPKGAVTTPRVTLHIKEGVGGTYWNKRYVEVNLSIPDLEEDIADMHLLGKAENKILSHFKKPRAGEIDGGSYEYSLESNSQEQDSQLRCHFVHIRLQFQILNTL